ncbi:MAG: hypothetical protein CME65_15695 [Halobacteriovoraceae bacterium]|nr:hypothetical protein [Halobacteriovoraceae bacterium]
MSEMICSNCGVKGQVKKHTPGSIWIEIILWCFMIIPGLIYSIWRMVNKKKICKSCSSEALVSVNSPVGQQLVERFHKPATQNALQDKSA